ncbi:MAG: hypothetical protein KF774_17710 [Planctomyces sp.]|nr:hypothetical protein [Planctomyces sp.]
MRPVSLSAAEVHRALAGGRILFRKVLDGDADDLEADDCPIAQVGELLWVREAFFLDHCDYVDTRRMERAASRFRSASATEMLRRCSGRRRCRAGRPA